MSAALVRDGGGASSGCAALPGSACSRAVRPLSRRGGAAVDFGGAVSRAATGSSAWGATAGGVVAAGSVTGAWATLLGGVTARLAGVFGTLSSAVTPFGLAGWRRTKYQSASAGLP